MPAVRTVVCHNKEPVGSSFELIFKNQQILAAETDNACYLAAHFMQLLCNGQSDGAADAAADDANALQPFDMGCNAKGTDEILNVFAFFFCIKQSCCCADNLENDSYCALFSVITRNGQGDSLAVFVDAQNDELTGFCLFRHEGSFDFHHGDGRIEFFSQCNLIH